MLVNVLLLLAVAIPSSVAEDQCQTALVQSLPDSSFHATSEFNETTTASDVRNTSEGYWCPKTIDDDNDFITVDLGCELSVCSVQGHGPSFLLFSLKHSNDNTNWEVVTSDDTTYYDPNLESFEAGHKAVITPPVQARYFRFQATYFFAWPCVKFELFGGPELSVSQGSFQPVGCYKEKSKKSVRFMPDVYHTVKGVDKENPEISAVYEECRQKAEESPKPIKVFGIRNYNKCVTTESGAEDELDKYVKSVKCVVCLGKGIGAGTLHMFVYNKNV